MISIFSENEAEYSTEVVMDWLISKNIAVNRINGVDILNRKFKLIVNEDNSTDPLKIGDIIWYRRWIHFYYYDFLGEHLHGKTFSDLKNFLHSELRTVSDYLFKLYKVDRIWLDHPDNVKLNKIEVLSLASKLSIKIPETIITNNRADLVRYFGDKKIITKTIENIVPIDFQVKYESFFMQTFIINIREINDEFYPSLFQNYIEKRFEIRSFYLDNEFYSMAIFSQNSEKTMIDFRNYDRIHPSRTVPYKLPNKLMFKLNKLINELGLEHCSIDLIKEPDGDITFLEINPIGQFGMVSTPCNYYLEEKIADYLIKKDCEIHERREFKRSIRKTG